MARNQKSTPSAMPAAPAPGPAIRGNREPVARWLIELNPFQQRIAELVGDLIINGGHEDDAKMIIKAAMRHYWDRISHSEDQKKKNEEAEEYADKWGSDWYVQLASRWPAKKAPKPDQPKPTAIADMIRANYRGRLESEFEDWMKHHTEGLEEVILLADILNTSSSFDGPLGEAFAYSLESSHTYVQVPRKHEEHVRDFLKILEASTAKDAANAAPGK